MNAELVQALTKCDTDIEGVMYRFADNEEVYISCLIDFVADNTMKELEIAIENEAWDDAFTAAHALKGLAGNMGFIYMFHITSNMVVQIRGGKVTEIAGLERQLKENYDNIVRAIEDNCVME